MLVKTPPTSIVGKRMLSGGIGPNMGQGEALLCKVRNGAKRETKLSRCKRLQQAKPKVLGIMLGSVYRGAEEAGLQVPGEIEGDRDGRKGKLMVPSPFLAFSDILSLAATS